MDDALGDRRAVKATDRLLHAPTPQRDQRRAMRRAESSPRGRPRSSSSGAPGWCRGRAAHAQRHRARSGAGGRRWRSSSSRRLRGLRRPKAGPRWPVACGQHESWTARARRLRSQLVREAHVLEREVSGATCVAALSTASGSRALLDSDASRRGQTGVIGRCNAVLPRARRRRSASVTCVPSEGGWPVARSRPGGASVGLDTRTARAATDRAAARHVATTPSGHAAQSIAQPCAHSAPSALEHARVRSALRRGGHTRHSRDRPIRATAPSAGSTASSTGCGLSSTNASMPSSTSAVTASRSSTGCAQIARPVRVRRAPRPRRTAPVTVE